MRVIGKTDIGRRRNENQDSFRLGYLPEGIGWGIVCDGMGGGQDGRLASTLAVESIEKRLRKSFAKRPPNDKILSIMQDAIRRANYDIFTVSGNGSIIMGTTVVCVIVKGNMLYVAHAGDSRAYVQNNGILKQITRDHSMVQELIDNGVLTEQQASVHPEKNVITRALGIEADIAVETQKLEISSKSVIMLCSDGLSNMLSSEQIEKIINENDFYDTANRLVEAALIAGGFDNIAVALLQNHHADG